MKGSRVLLMVACLLAIGPALAVKLSMWLKYQSSDWIVHTSKGHRSMTGIDSINLDGVKTFRYKYNPDSSYLEYNTLFENIFLKSDQNGKLTIVENELPIEKKYYLPPPSYLFSLLAARGMFFGYFHDIFTTGTKNIVFHGPVCPTIRAVNSVFYIESAAPHGSFDFDLDFSTVYWENYSQKTDGKFDKKLTIPWYLNELNLKLNQSQCHLLDNLHFNKIHIKAIRKTDLDIVSNNYKEAFIEVDSTVTLRAPITILNKLKLIIKN